MQERKRHLSYRQKIWHIYVIYCIKLTLVISNTDISKYPLISKNIVWTHFLFFFTFSTLVTSNYCYLKVNFLRPENLL